MNCICFRDLVKGGLRGLWKRFLCMPETGNLSMLRNYSSKLIDIIQRLRRSFSQSSSFAQSSLSLGESIKDHSETHQHRLGTHLQNCITSWSVGSVYFKPQVSLTIL
jgi:hypothetical protein